MGGNKRDHSRPWIPATDPAPAKRPLKGPVYVREGSSMPIYRSSLILAGYTEEAIDQWVTSGELREVRFT